MNILIEYPGVLPALKYGGTERAIWCLGKALHESGHKITFLVRPGSSCPFARIIPFHDDRSLNEAIPDDIDIALLSSVPDQEIRKPYAVNIQGNGDPGGREYNIIFVSANHAERHGAEAFVHNGLYWDDFPRPDFRGKRNTFHFLGKAAWRVKNVKGAIRIAQKSGERLAVLGGHRLNLKMGFRLTLDPRVTFHGMVDDEQKYQVMKSSKGLIFPVRWHEPFGIALTESLFMGCPVFGTPYGSLPEIVKPGMGVLSTSADELAYAVRHVDQFDAKACSDYAIEFFNAHRMAKAYLRYFERVLSGEKLNREKPRLLQQQQKFLPFSY